MIETTKLVVHRVAFLICLGGPVCPVASGETGSVTKAAPPVWVRPVEWRTSEASSIGAEATRYLLYDWQQYPSREEAYTRVVVLLLNESGVADFGSLTFSFDPSYQDLRLHSIRVHRGAEALDRLDISSVKVIQPERQLDWNIYTGEHTATVFLEDLRVGDVLEYAFTVHGRNPIVASHYATRFSTRWSTAVDRAFYRVVWSEETALHRGNHRTDVQLAANS